MKIKRKMNRRKFLELSAKGAVATGASALMIDPDGLFAGNNSKTIQNNAKKIFQEKGACSQTFFHLLNREFGHLSEAEERASDPLAGGLMMTQNQCGMLWGSALAAGAESFRRYNDRDQAVAKAISTSQRLVESFFKRTKTVNCRNITCDFNNKFELVKFMLKSLPGGYPNFVCMNLAEKWVPEAIQSAKEGLSEKQTALSQQPISCACEVAKKMGAGDKEMITVAGLAGGIGLSGNGCGALSAAIWLNSLAWCRKNPGESGSKNPTSDEILKKFYSTTGSEILCSKISGQRFKTIGDHTNYIKNGGCEKLINVLARSQSTSKG